MGTVSEFFDQIDQLRQVGLLGDTITVDRVATFAFLPPKP